MNKPDGLIFDMDGTLWDAVDTYAKSYNQVFKELNINKTVDRDELAELVGLEGKKVIESLAPNSDEEQRKQIYTRVNEIRREIIPQLGGILYEDVKDGLKQLAEHYKVFIVSNCGAGIIKLFIEWAGIGEYITDELANGVNLMPKHHNINLIVEKHQLKNPVYIGDTEGDSEQSAKAGVPFVLVTYGFGKSDKYDLKFDDFASLIGYFLNLK